MARFSANLGFLWADLPLVEAIHAAKTAGFDAVECHWPFNVPARSVARALGETRLSMLVLNTHAGDLSKPEFGLSALPERQLDALAAIDHAIEYGAVIGVQSVHVMAGITDAETAHDVFLDNLKYACMRADKHSMDILIEPLNSHDVPGYFLTNTRQAAAIIDDIAAPNLKLMFDCYHVGRTEGDIAKRFRDLRHLIGHVQFASIPDRGPPICGEPDLGSFFSMLDDVGWIKPLGAEYRPIGTTADSLGWLVKYSKSRLHTRRF